MEFTGKTATRRAPRKQPDDASRVTISYCVHAMPLPPNTRLGPYEILGLLGAGGMGEVYRARDTRLERNVAIKVITSGYVGDPVRVRRFEQEARAAGALNHPNVVTVFDIGEHEGLPFVVMELLEGKTLRDWLGQAPLPTRKAIAFATQVSRGLAAAHEKGIVHRDLKPENLFITADGRVKILDFGLAKLMKTDVAPPPGERQGEETLSASLTESGVVLGTAGYMAPEQIRGDPADRRSDLFALGAIVYEMLSGASPFPGISRFERAQAVLHTEPEPLRSRNARVPSMVESLVARCLEKDPANRFESAGDLAIVLETVGADLAPMAAQHQTAIGKTLATDVVREGRDKGKGGPPLFSRLTFKRGRIWSARFAPDGNTFYYSAAWEGDPLEVFLTRSESPESHSMGLPPAGVLSVSPGGEMLLLLGGQLYFMGRNTGTLARAPLVGGMPREVVEEVEYADWGFDGASLCIVRRNQGRDRLEFPAGNVLRETAGWFSHPRISPRGDQIAVIEHPLLFHDDGSVMILDAMGAIVARSSGWISCQGLAWEPSGEEVWFTATRTGLSWSLHALSTSGDERLVTRGAGPLCLMDISRDGRVLLTHGNWRSGILGLPPGGGREREYSWLDWSTVTDISRDGRVLLFNENGEGGGPAHSIYLRNTDGSLPIRLGTGFGVSLSPDGRWVLTIQGPADELRLVLVPTGAGEPRPLDPGPLRQFHYAELFPDGRHVLFAGSEDRCGIRFYMQDVEHGMPRPLTPEGYTAHSSGSIISRDGKFFVAQDAEGRGVLFGVRGGKPRVIPGLERRDLPIRWDDEGRTLYLFRRGEFPARLERLDLVTGQRQHCRDLQPPDPAGIVLIQKVLITSDASSYFYSYWRDLDDLYLVDGLV
jgi:eukaryotic-like serine/threonine-protein kinase